MNILRPRIYTASKVHRAPMWRDLRATHDSMFAFTSTWINEDISPLDDLSEEKCREGWCRNMIDVQNSDYLIAYGEKGDTLSGTLVEIGGLIAGGGLVILVGDYDWRTWQHHPSVRRLDTFPEGALLYILSHFRNK